MRTFFGREIHLPTKQDFVEMAWVYPLALLLACLILVFIGEIAAHADWEGSPYKGWAEKQQVAPAARQRMYCPEVVAPDDCSCCDGAEIVKTQFRVSKTTGGDEWWFVSPVTGKWKRIPDDVIHGMDEHTPTGQPVLFLYPKGSDNPRCFFRGDTGG